MTGQLQSGFNSLSAASRLKKSHQKYKNTGVENICILNYHVYKEYYEWAQLC